MFDLLCHRRQSVTAQHEGKAGRGFRPGEQGCVSFTETHTYVAQELRSNEGHIASEEHDGIDSRGLERRVNTAERPAAGQGVATNHAHGQTEFLRFRSDVAQQRAATQPEPGLIAAHAFTKPTG